MPFLGQDWRSPGEHWIKTSEGWERLKLLGFSSSHLPALGEGGSVADANNKENSMGRMMPMSLPCLDASGNNSHNDDNDDDDGESSAVSKPIQIARSHHHEHVKSSSLHDPCVKFSLDSQGDDCDDDDVNDGDARNRHCSGDDITDNSSSCSPPVLPHCFITTSSSRERPGRCMSSSLSEAFYRLDFQGAVRDIRRFNYVSKLLHSLISLKLSSLGGSAQKVLFSLVEEVLEQVLLTQQNLGTLKHLIQQLDSALSECLPCKAYIGCEHQWSGRVEQVEAWRSRLGEASRGDQLQAPHRTLMQLPDDCIRLIMLRLSDHRDIINASKVADNMTTICMEQSLWRSLCFYHFNEKQIAKLVENARFYRVLLRPAYHRVLQSDVMAAGVASRNDKVTSCDNDEGEGVKLNDYNTDWQRAFSLLKRYHGLREQFADMIHLCRNCKALFWKSLGHPCVLRELDLDQSQGQSSVPVTPQAFIDLFL